MRYVTKIFQYFKQRQETRFVGLVGLIRQASIQDKVAVHKLTKKLTNYVQGNFHRRDIIDLQIANGSWKRQMFLADAERKK